MGRLVAYFSYGGVTKRIAEQLANELDATTFEIKPAMPYTRADVNWQDNTSRNVKEYKDVSSRPEFMAYLI
ncbi:MAG TPA: flavodoxin [Clostridia bacterium]|jgi:flavodoxin|nr:flavodoxin [Clostridia bacterium]HPY42752.1 flavodoxin [Clostridia bacterium]HQA96578.1 flavodoxin [Clostridia bacterium]HQO54725.1 flavodoxin [Clostridia bacterium]HUM60085.1 flavodoxin [Clostridia bacterium]